MPTRLPKGKLIAYRADMSCSSFAEYQQCLENLERIAEMVSIAPEQNLKVYWQYQEPISELVDLPADCQVSPWVD